MFSWSKEHKRAMALAKDATKSIYGDNVETRIGRISQSPNSTRIRVVALQRGYPDLLVKVTRPRDVQGHLGPDITSLPSVSMRLQNRFRVDSPEWLRIPRVLLSDDSTGILVMEYTGGLNLKRVLRGKAPHKGLEVNSIAELCGRALAHWHSSWHADADESSANPRDADSAQVLSFLDFSVWNIMINENMKGITLFDFPGHKMFAPRERDLASFLHSLLVVAHHPLTILRHPDWWNWRETYFAFLAGYQDASSIQLTHDDLQLIAANLRAIVDREIANYKRKELSVRYLMEGAWYSRLRNHAALRPQALASLVDH